MAAFPAQDRIQEHRAPRRHRLVCTAKSSGTDGALEIDMVAPSRARVVHGVGQGSSHYEGEPEPRAMDESPPPWAEVGPAFRAGGAAGRLHEPAEGCRAAARRR